MVKVLPNKYIQIFLKLLVLDITAIQPFQFKLQKYGVYGNLKSLKLTHTHKKKKEFIMIQWISQQRIPRLMLLDF